MAASPLPGVRRTMVSGSVRQFLMALRGFLIEQ